MATKMTWEQERELMQVLSTMQQLIYSEQCKKTINQIIGKDIVIFLGNTRSGKSTIVNYVIGNKLMVVKTGRRYHIEAVTASAGPTIGAGSMSETTIPTAWSSTKIDGIIVDAPGFDDNRGEAQDVANSFYIKELLTNAKSVKFALICDIHDILLDNINQFISFTDKIFTMLPQCGTLQTGMVMIFNKNTEVITKDDICEELQIKVIKQKQIQLQNRCLIHYLVNNPKHIVITNTPKVPGELEDTVFSDIVDVIKEEVSPLSKELVAAVTPGISDRSRVFLLVAHSYFTESRDLDAVLSATEVAFLEKMNDENFSLDTTLMSQLKTVKKNLMAAEMQINSLREAQRTVPETLQALSAVLPSVEALKSNNDIYMKLKFISFVDQILKIEESNILKVKVDALLSKLKDKVVNLRIGAQEKLLEISTEEADRKFKELQEQFKKQEIQFLKSISEMQEKQIEVLMNMRPSESNTYCVLQ